MSDSVTILGSIVYNTTTGSYIHNRKQIQLKKAYHFGRGKSKPSFGTQSTQTNRTQSFDAMIILSIVGDPLTVPEGYLATYVS